MARSIQIILLLVLIGSGSFAQPQGFIPNRGQWKGDFDYRLRLVHGAVFLKGNSYTVNLLDTADLPRHGHADHEKTDRKRVIDAHSYQVEFVGASLDGGSVGLAKSESYFNYILGDDRSNWQSHVPLFGKVTYADLYPGIDLQYYFSEDENLKYDLLLEPGARTDVIRLRYTGTDDLRLSGGNLIVETSVGNVTETAPVAYQVMEGKRVPVSCSYTLSGDEVSFRIGKYDPTETLVIDPQLVFSTYTGATEDNWGYTATYGEGGSVYAGGIIFSGPGIYPTTSGAYQLSFSGGDCDVAISKFSADGSSLIYSTYLGGSNSEMPYSLYENLDKTLIVMGSTSSLDFPVTANAYDTSFNGGTGRDFSSGYIQYSNGGDIFLTAIDSSGGSLVGSTYFGGSENDGFNVELEHNYGDIFRGEVIADRTGNIFGAFSTNSTNLPVGTGAFRPGYSGVQDGFVVSFSPDLSTLRWGTYIGGALADNALSIKKGPGNEVYVAGGSKGGGLVFPGNGMRSRPIGDADGYILRLSDADGSYLNGTYNGTPARDMNFFVDIDNRGEVYVFGQTRGEYPLLGDSLYAKPGSGQFINKFSADLGASLRSITFGDSSHAGSSISPTAFMVDACRNIFLSGWGGGNNASPAYGYLQGTTDSLPVTPDAYKPSTDGEDFYFMVLDHTWENLKYATFFGGNRAEHVDGGTSRFSEKGVIYQAVCAGCGGNSSFPSTPGAWSTQNQSNNCNLAAIKLEFENNAIEARAVADKQSGCIPFTANLTSLSVNADTYQWQLPGGQLVQSDTASLVISTKGEHIVRLIAFDTVCLQVDSVDLVLQGIDDSVFAEAVPTVDSTCFPGMVEISNLSYNADSVVWKSADGSIVGTDTMALPITTDGPNVFRLIATNTACGLEDSTEIVVYGRQDSLEADFDAQFDPCDDSLRVRFVNESINADRFEWHFGDGDTSFLPAPEHSYTAAGEHQVELIAENTSCGNLDTARFTVSFPEKINNGGIQVSYDPCAAETDIVFDAGGSGYHRFDWSFGDGETAMGRSVEHYFEEPGAYRVHLEMTDTICGNFHQADTLLQVYGSVGIGEKIPNVFTPNNDGKNDYFGLPADLTEKSFSFYSLRVYNRWGKKLYASESVSEPWDGRFDGAQVPEGVYFYLLDFVDECGHSRELKGFVHLFYK